MSRHGAAAAASLVPIDAPDFDLELTLTCGQVFHWTRHEAGWLGTIGDLPVFVVQRGATLLTNRGAEEQVAHYFALDHALEAIRATFPRDAAMVEAAQFCRGLRILRQPPWECLATFITSSMKRVAHIAQISQDMRQRFGRPRAWAGHRLFSYPDAACIAALDEAALRECRLGYRAKHLLQTARMVAEGALDLTALADADDESARAALCCLPGVGEKIANCVLLFGFGRLRAFPIDVWIERVLRAGYFRGQHEVTTKRLRSFSHDYFGPYGGYAQQYLFHHARMLGPRTALPRPKQSGSAHARVRRAFPQRRITKPKETVARLETMPSAPRIPRHRPGSRSVTPPPSHPVRA